ncbi:hypothetical protein UFOVP221_49 [uncultured Caudovirales phage]|uniref:Uncharacterized protein n=1 Tax=uncultured Caudovirales phage TaxID=2100421 RepID=A0A6J7WMH5_9CAUD|nr:hypothetical protein UFOVP221_49 [uncultured Caudovirales phage]
MDDMTTTTYYIGTTKEYREGDAVEDKLFYFDFELAKQGAQMRAERAGALFGMVYEISHEVTDESGTEVRQPSRVVKFVDWSI